MNESRHTYERVTSVTWHSMCDVTRSYVWRDSFICVMWEWVTLLWSQTSPCYYHTCRCVSHKSRLTHEWGTCIMSHVSHINKMCISQVSLLPSPIPLKVLHPRNPPNPQTQIPRHKFNWNQNLRLNLHSEILRTLSVSMWWISGV